MSFCVSFFLHVLLLVSLGIVGLVSVSVGPCGEVCGCFSRPYVARGGSSQLVIMDTYVDQYEFLRNAGPLRSQDKFLHTFK
jgi:hypothetical protein